MVVFRLAPQGALVFGAHMLALLDSDLLPSSDDRASRSNRPRLAGWRVVRASGEGTSTGFVGARIVSVLDCAARLGLDKTDVGCFFSALAVVLLRIVRFPITSLSMSLSGDEEYLKDRGDTSIAWHESVGL